MASREQEVEGKEKGRRHEYGVAFQRSRTLTLTIFKDPNVLCPWSDAADAMLPGRSSKDRELFVQTVTQHGGQARRRKQKHLQEIEILSIMKLVSS